MVSDQIIKDDQITASSYYPESRFKPHQGRLGNPNGAWCAKKGAEGQQHLQVDLGKFVSG